MDEDFEDGPELSLDELADKFLADKSEEDDEEETTEEESPEETSEDEAEETEEEESSEEETEEESDEEDEGDKKKPKSKVSDDDEIEVPVNGKVEKFKVADLKRLAGQEAALTQRSQSVAAQTKALEAQGLYLAKILDARYKDAKAKAEKYANVDLFKASRELEPDEFDALHSAKKAADLELATIDREAKEFLQNAQQTRQTILREKAKESLKVITKAIPDWNDQVYSKVRSYAVSQGMNPGDVNEVVDPGAIIMMHKAMMFDQAQTKKSVVEKKIAKSPKKVIKKADKVSDATEQKLKAKRHVAESTGDLDAIADLFLAAQKANS